MRKQMSIHTQAPESGRNNLAGQAGLASAADSRARQPRALQEMAARLTQATARARLFPRHLRRSLIALLATLALSSSFVLAAVPGASAMEGEVPDSRTADPVGEISAYYWHGLNRDPDPGGLNSYVWYANKDCRWGIQSAATDILDSAEAHNVWRNNPQTLAGMLYAALLNRPPDPGGLATYTAAIAQHGLRWAITSMLASGEFQGRLGRICAGRASTNATAWNSHDAMVQAIRINNGATDLVYACGAGLLIQTFSPIGVFKGAGWIIRAARLAAGAVAHVSGSCNAAYIMLQAADTTASLADYEGANNPVFLEADTSSYWNGYGHWCSSNIRVGPSAIQWTGYSASYRC